MHSQFNETPHLSTWGRIITTEFGCARYPLEVKRAVEYEDRNKQQNSASPPSPPTPSLSPKPEVFCKSGWRHHRCCAPRSARSSRTDRVLPRTDHTWVFMYHVVRYFGSPRAVPLLIEREKKKERGWRRGVKNVVKKTKFIFI